MNGYYNCPTCNAPIQLSVSVAHVCDPNRIVGAIVIDEAPVPLTEADVRRIVREELASKGRK
jgi:hypothetical protein